MDRADVQATLDRVRTELEDKDEGPVDLSELGFWRAVGVLKRHPTWVEEFAEAVGALDRKAFERAVRPTFPPEVGNSLLVGGTVLSLALVSVAYQVSQPWDGVLVLAGTAGLLGSTHGLAHFVIGRMSGIRFTHWYLDGPTRLQPSLKLDYASYLRTPPRARAWMHASGAILTKVIPFLMIGAARAAQTPAWTTWILLAVGVTQLVTDALFSVTRSDWKRFIREMRVARDLET